MQVKSNPGQWVTMGENRAFNLQVSYENRYTHTVQCSLESRIVFLAYFEQTNKAVGNDRS